MLQLSGAAQLFSGAQHVHSLADAAQVGPALTALTQSALPSPLHATLATPGIGLDYKVSLDSCYVSLLDKSMHACC